MLWRELKAAGVAAVLLGGVMGCTHTGHTPPVKNALTAFYDGDYAHARAQLEPMAAKTDEDYVLNNLRLGSVALAAGDLDLAEDAFFKAYEVMNSTGVNDGGRGAAAALVHEKFKIWKGEPYERAMCNFYLGLIYYMREDWNNARAAFENALFKLRDYGEKDLDENRYAEAESNFACAYIMLGKTWLKLGEQDKAEKILSEVAELRPDLAGVADSRRNEVSNVLLAIEFGSGPMKVTRGDNSIVAFEPTPEQAGPVLPLAVKLNGHPVKLDWVAGPSVDLFEVAQDRRWQSIDTIRLTKSIVGTGLMAGGSYVAAKGSEEHNRKEREREQLTGAALIAAGALLKASAGADLRYWDTLPRSVSLLPLKLRPGEYDASIEFGPRGEYRKQFKLTVPAEGEVAQYVRLFHWNAAGPTMAPVRVAPRPAMQPMQPQRQPGRVTRAN
jgi:tetratricopeptide (TPR) repeat protein